MGGNNREREATPMIIAGECCGRWSKVTKEAKRKKGEESKGPLLVAVGVGDLWSVIRQK